MKEKDMQVLFGKHLKENPPNQTEVYELKICKGTSLPFNSLAEHQVEALLEAEDKGLYHKVSDQPVSWGMNSKLRFTAKKPFDCFFAKCPAYVVVWFYKPRQPKFFIKIRIKNFVEMRFKANRKSFTEEMAQEYGNNILLIGKHPKGAYGGSY